MYGKGLYTFTVLTSQHANGPCLVNFFLPFLFPSSSIMYDSSSEPHSQHGGHTFFAFEYQGGIYHQTRAAQSLGRRRGFWDLGLPERGKGGAGGFSLDDGIVRGPCFVNWAYKQGGTCAERDCYKYLTTFGKRRAISKGIQSGVADVDF